MDNLEPQTMDDPERIEAHEQLEAIADQLDSGQLAVDQAREWANDELGFDEADRADTDSGRATHGETTITNPPTCNDQ